MAELENLTTNLRTHLADFLQGDVTHKKDELTIEINAADLPTVGLILRDHADFKFEILIDISGIDYLDYGLSEWTTEKATGTGFERARNKFPRQRFLPPQKQRFALAYHFLSITHNQRVRVKIFLPEESLMVPSLVDLWSSANWYEREAFDLYGIQFKDHPDLRRLLTDYGFVGHPFRKDFPLSGNVEVRYDAVLERVIYEPIEIEPRILVPKVIRD